MKLLIVDDNQQNIYMLQTLLSANGFEVEQASNGAEALEQARRAPPDVIISDILMPVMDGFALCRACKEDKLLRKIPFIFYTATYTDPQDKDFALGLGAEQFIVKPVEPDKFLALLRETIEAYQQGKKLVTPRKPVGQTEYYKKYNAALIHKLEKKAFQLKEANRALESDVTELKQTEEALRISEESLREAEARYRALVEQIPVVVYTDSAELVGHTLYISPRIKEVFGCTPEEWIENDDLWFDFILPEDQDRVKIVNDSANKTGQPFSAEYRINTREGQVKWILDQAVLVRDEAGNPLFWQGVLSDITERKQIEGALKLFRALINQSNDAIEVLDPEKLKFLDFNERACSSLGYSREELLSLTIFDVDPNAEQFRDIGIVQKLQESGFATMESLHRRKDGSSFPVELSMRYVQLDGGYIVTVVRDITERKKSEKELRESEEKYRSLVDNIKEGIFLSDEEGKITFANKELANIHGFSSPEQLLGKHFTEFIEPSARDKISQDHEREMQSGGVQSLLDFPIVKPDGSLAYIQVRPTPILEGGRIIGLRGIVQDITERKRAEEELARQAGELRQRNEELARLYRAFGSLISEVPLNPKEQAQRIIDVVLREFGQANCGLFIIQEDLNELVCLVAAGAYAGQAKYPNLALDGPGLIPLAVRSNKVINVGDVHSAPDYVQGWDATQSELVIPLRVGDNVIGVIDVQSAEPNAFSQDDERPMTVFAERAALAIEHSRLNAQTEARMQQLAALRTIDMAISGSFDVKLTLGILLNQLIGQIKVHAADVLIFDATTQTFKFAGGRGFRTQQLQHTQLKFGAGFAWRAIRDRQTIVVPNAKIGPDDLQRTPDLSGEQFAAYMGIPLVARGQIKGLLEVFHREPLLLEKDRNSFLEILAGQAAIAIDNAELFDRLQGSNTELAVAYDNALEGWARAVELRNKEMDGHTQSMAELTMQLARTLGVEENGMMHIYRGALLHDVGEMMVPDSILLKPGPLTEDEQAIIHKHPQYAYDMLSQVTYLQPALDIPYFHHEKWDGTGYPRGLQGEQIPLAARIFAVVDVWDALTSDRPYRKAWAEEEARSYIREQANLHFDPHVVRAFLEVSFPKK